MSEARHIPGDKLGRSYTPQACADAIIKMIRPHLPPGALHVIEPCVGGGAFIRACRSNLTVGLVTGIDLDPDAPGFEECDDCQHANVLDKSFNGLFDLSITNPPFGKVVGQKTTIAIIEKAIELATVCVILMPIDFASQVGYAALSNSTSAIVPVMPRPFPHERGMAVYVWGLPAGAELPTTLAWKNYRPKRITTPPSTKEAAVKSYIKTVKTNIKGRDTVPRSYQLGEKTLILGPNGSGKSAISQALELALVGRPTDIAGKDPKTAAAIATLAPPGATELIVDLSDDADRIVGTARQDLSGKTPKKPKTSILAGFFLPLAELKEAMSSDAKAQRFIFAATGGELTWTDIENKIPEGEERRLFNTLVSAENCKRDPAGSLLQARAGAHDAYLEARSRASGAKKMIEGIGSALAPMPTEAQLLSAQELVTNLGAASHGAAGVAQAAADRAALTAQYQALAAERAAHVTKIRELEEIIDIPTPEQQNELAASQERIIAAGLLLDRLTAVESMHCGLCAQPVPHGHWGARRAAIDAVAQAKTYQLTYVRLVAAVAVLDVKTNDIATRLQGLPVASAAVAAPSSGADMQAAQQSLMQLQQLKGQHAALQSARATQSDAETKRDMWQRIEKRTIEAVSELIEGSRTSFIARVQKFLTKGDVFGLELNPLRFGLVREEQLHTALSGAEYARVTMALASVISAGRDGTPVIIPPDRAWDAKTLGATMRALAKSPAQIVLCTTTKPSGRVPAGWTIIKPDEKPQPAAPVVEEPAAAKDEPAAAAPTEEPAPARVAEPETPAWTPERAAELTALGQAVIADFMARPGITGMQHANGKTGADIQQILVSHIQEGLQEDAAVWFEQNVHWGQELLAQWLSANPQHSPQLGML